MKNIVRNVNSAVKAGDLLLSEQPFAFVLSSKDQGNRCDNCLQKVKLLKCSGCQFVHYCGRTCQKEAWSEHKRFPGLVRGSAFLLNFLHFALSSASYYWECANFKRVAPKVVPDGARMLAKVINRLNRGDGHSHRAFYTTTSFRMWKDLMSHYSDLKTDKKRMEHFTSLSVVLYEFLNDMSLPNAVELMGLYGRMIINSFMILDMDMNSIGTGIYLASSIVDHSCNPNAIVTFDGKTINIRSVQDMPSLDWSQIRISYIDLMKTPYERQTELLESYYFLCECPRCMDGTQAKYVYAAKCLNVVCDNPISIPWKGDCEIVRKPNNLETKPNNSCDMKNKLSRESNSNITQNGEYEKKILQNGEYDKLYSNGEYEENVIKDETKHENIDSISNLNGLSLKTAGDFMCCDVCKTKYTDKDVKVFAKTMEFTRDHLQSMEGASVAYVDVCNYCLERHEGVLHPLNVMHAQTLDHAFDALIQMQLWEKACLYAEKLIPCFRFYYGENNPLVGLLHMKYGKILLYKMDMDKCVRQLKFAEKIIKLTHGVTHPLYREHLLPLLQQAIMESS